MGEKPIIKQNMEDINNVLSNKLDKVTGKTLTTNDFTDAYKTKLDGIATSAEVNQNTFANIKVGTTTISADNKSDTLELVAGTNITLTPDATNDKVTINNTYSYTHPGTHAASMITEDSTHRFTTDAEKTAWNAKANGTHTHAISDVTNLQTTLDGKLGSTANAVSASKLATARTISLTGDVTGSITFDGSANASITATVVDDSHNHTIANVDNLQTTLDAKTPFSTKAATTAATAGWYRIASSAINIGANSGLFKIEFNGVGVMGRALFIASCHNGTAAGSAINQLGFTTTAGTLGLTQIRVVYHTTYTGNYAYVEIYNPTALAITYTVDLIDATGWSLLTPNTAGSIPTGYTSESLILDTGLVSMEDVTATRQLRSNIATGTAPLVVNSTTVVPNLNAYMLEGNRASAFAPASHNHTSAQISDATNANTANMIVKRDASGNFSAGTITATLSGNAASSTKLATARTISLTGDVTGSVTFDGSANASITATVVDDSHNHTIANVDNLQTTLANMFVSGSATFTSGSASRTFTVAACKTTSLVTIVITGTVDPQGNWIVDSQAGQFVITSDATETANITFNYFVQSPA